jgi:hypothetical protein
MQRTYFCMLRVAVSLLQKYVRGFLQRRRFLEMRQAAKNIQCHWRDFLERRAGGLDLQGSLQGSMEDISGGRPNGAAEASDEGGNLRCPVLPSIRVEPEESVGEDERERPRLSSEDFEEPDVSQSGKKLPSQQQGTARRLSSQVLLQRKALENALFKSGHAPPRLSSKDLDLPGGLLGEDDEEEEEFQADGEQSELGRSSSSVDDVFRRESSAESLSLPLKKLSATSDYASGDAASILSESMTESSPEKDARRAGGLVVQSKASSMKSLLSTESDTASISSHDVDVNTGSGSTLPSYDVEDESLGTKSLPVAVSGAVWSRIKMSVKMTLRAIRKGKDKERKAKISHGRRDSVGSTESDASLADGASPRRSKNSSAVQSELAHSSKSSAPIPGQVVWEDAHLGMGAKYGASSVLQDTGRDLSSDMWAAPSGLEKQSFIIDFGMDVRVGRIHIRNSGNNEFGFERGTRDFAIDFSLDGRTWYMLVKGTLPSARGKTASERSDLVSGTAKIPWHSEKFKTTVMRYLRFTATNFYGHGAALNTLLTLPPVGDRVTRPSHVMIDSLQELNRLEQVCVLLSLSCAGRMTLFV